MDAPLRIALVTYSTRPRGGMVHTLHLAQALHAAGQPVHVFALGGPREGFFRPTTVPHTIFPAPQPTPTLEERVFAAVDALAEGLSRVAGRDHDLLHAQDCIAARAAVRVRDTTSGLPVLRTVHHVDDFATATLVDRQRRSIVEPDGILVVSEYWRRVLARDYGVTAAVVTNGVDAGRSTRRSAPTPPCCGHAWGPQPVSLPHRRGNRATQRQPRTRGGPGRSPVTGVARAGSGSRRWPLLPGSPRLP